LAVGVWIGVLEEREKGEGENVRLKCGRCVERRNAEIRMSHLLFGPLLGLFSVAGSLFVPSVFISF
jgi:hypothetical protein